MAISKTVISSISDLRDFLEDSGYFDSVTLENSVVTCKDADENILAKFESNKATAYIDDTTSAAKSFSNVSIRAAYTCSNGIIIEYGGAVSSYMPMYTLITKTNNNKIAFIIQNTLSTSGSSSVYCVAWGDENANIFSHIANIANQTIMMPFGTRSVLGTPSYTPYAYTITYGQYYNSGIGSISIDGTVFLTNGYWAIKDA